MQNVKRSQGSYLFLLLTLQHFFFWKCHFFKNLVLWAWHKREEIQGTIRNQSKGCQQNVQNSEIRNTLLQTNSAYDREFGPKWRTLIISSTPASAAASVGRCNLRPQNLNGRRTASKEKGGERRPTFKIPNISKRRQEAKEETSNSGGFKLMKLNSSSEHSSSTQPFSGELRPHRGEWKRPFYEPSSSSSSALT